MDYDSKDTLCLIKFKNRMGKRNDEVCVTNHTGNILLVRVSPNIRVVREIANGFEVSDSSSHAHAVGFKQVFKAATEGASAS